MLNKPRLFVGFVVLLLLLALISRFGPKTSKNEPTVIVPVEEPIEWIPSPVNKPKRLKIVKIVPAARPKMPWQPTSSGPLNNLVVVLDPGHGGSDPGAGWTETFTSRKTGTTEVDYWEASYTYRMTGELADMLRAQGATVYVTVYSETMLDRTPIRAQESLARPFDAVAMWDGKPNRAGFTGRSKRAKYVNWVKARTSSDKQIVFLSLHIDSMNPDWSGGHICVTPSRKENPPKVAVILANQFVAKKIARSKKGELVRPLDFRGLDVVRLSRVPESMLVELGVPQNNRDSWRLRSETSRQNLLKVITESLVESTHENSSYTSLAKSW